MPELTTSSFLAALRDAVSDPIVVCSLGRTSVETLARFPDALAIDAMGAVTPLAAGVALGVDSDSLVLAIDTDGSFLMELSSIAVLPEVFRRCGERFRVIVLDNRQLEAASDSPRVPDEIDWVGLAGALSIQAEVIDRRTTLEVEALTAALVRNQILIVSVDNSEVETDLVPHNSTGRERAIRFREFIADREGRTLPNPTVKP